MKSDLIDLTMQLHAETAFAVLVSDDGENDNAVWLPKSQIEIDMAEDRGIATVTLPEWLAKDKGLI